MKKAGRSAFEAKYEYEMCAYMQNPRVRDRVDRVLQDHLSDRSIRTSLLIEQASWNPPRESKHYTYVNWDDAGAAGSSANAESPRNRLSSKARVQPTAPCPISSFTVLSLLWNQRITSIRLVFVDANPRNEEERGVWSDFWSAVFEYASSLREIVLERNRMRPDSLPFLPRLLLENHSIESICIRDNFIPPIHTCASYSGSEAVEKIDDMRHPSPVCFVWSQLLSRPLSPITRLNLDECGLDSDCVILLAKAFSKADGGILQHLSLRTNLFSREAFLQLVSSLKASSTLVSLDVSSCSAMGRSSTPLCGWASAFSKWVCDSPSLRVVKLANCFISPDHGLALVQGLPNCLCRSFCLDLTNNGLSVSYQFLVGLNDYVSSKSPLHDVLLFHDPSHASDNTRTMTQSSSFDELRSDVIGEFDKGLQVASACSDAAVYEIRQNYVHLCAATADAQGEFLAFWLPLFHKRMGWEFSIADNQVEFRSRTVSSYKLSVPRTLKAFMTGFLDATDACANSCQSLFGAWVRRGGCAFFPSVLKSLTEATAFSCERLVSGALFPRPSSQLIQIYHCQTGSMFSAHRCVLEVSPFFRGLLASSAAGFEEARELSQNGRIVLHFENLPAVFPCILCFLYFGIPHFLEASNALQVLEFAHLFDLRGLVTQAEAFIIGRMGDFDCAELERTAVMYGLRVLQTKAHAVQAHNARVKRFPFSRSVS
eukprot:ANDGO_05671.mRNA.1 hypothetical protein